MQALLVIVGLLILLATTIDLLWTTLWPDGGAGPLTTRLAGLQWRAYRRISDLDRLGLRVLSIAGPLILGTTVLTWVVLLFTGWAIVFLAADGNVVSSSSGEAAGALDRLYFVGYSVFTLGNGDFRPSGTRWQVATVLLSGNGLVLITLAITFLLPVVSAAAEKRALAGQIRALGSGAEELVLTSWSHGSFDGLENPLVAVTSGLGTLANQHLAYPILHYFHAPEVRGSSGPAIAALDEALTIMRFAVRAGHGPRAAVLESARRTVRSYLDTLASGHIGMAHEEPPAPDLTLLRRAGLPLVADSEFRQAVDEISERRKLLLGLVKAEGHSWEEVR